MPLINLGRGGYTIENIWKFLISIFTMNYIPEVIIGIFLMAKIYKDPN